MRRLLPLCVAGALAASPAAHAGLSGSASGGWFDVSGGFSGGMDTGIGVGAELGFGGWFGRYDESFAVGRRWQLGPRLHFDQGFVYAGAPMRRWAPSFGFRRGIDLLVVGLRFGAEAGISVLEDRGEIVAIGVSARGDAALVYRFHPRVGLMLGVQLGVDMYPRPAVTSGINLGFEVAGPKRRAPAPTPLDVPEEPTPMEPTPVDVPEEPTPAEPTPSGEPISPIPD